MACEFPCYFVFSKMLFQCLFWGLKTQILCQAGTKYIWKRWFNKVSHNLLFLSITFILLFCKCRLRPAKVTVLHVRDLLVTLYSFLNSFYGFCTIHDVLWFKKGGNYSRITYLTIKTNTFLKFCPPNFASFQSLVLFSSIPMD